MTSERNQPLSGNAMPRFAGLATMMRLPAATSAQGLDAAFIGVPLDIGCSNRSGARFGPRQIRAESALLRPYNMATGAAPFDTLQVADLGDVPINTYSIAKSLPLISAFYDDVLAHNCKPLTLGGDHTIALPILRSIAKKHGPVALVHVDAHADVNDEMFGEPVAHGTPFRRAVDEGLLVNDRVWQIGLRGTGYAADDFEWPRSRGFNLVPAHDVWYRSIDPSFAGGTGTPEIGGLTVPQALEIIRGCRGLNLVGGDLVEVAPPYDPSGNTALLGANLLYEMLCVLPGVKCR
ncbi:MAG: agmatinase [Betaproteobacteria bacterium]|nr:MAG: agmatinase [Betaproteobacteria bacterium]